MLPYLIAAGTAVTVIGVIGMIVRYERKRTEELRAVATRIGWGFHEAVPFAQLPDLDRFELFTQGRRRKLTNVLTSPAGDPRAVLFDYSYTTGAGKSRRVHRQTVFQGASDDLQLPAFSLRPQHFGHTIAKAFGYQDIELHERPTLSEMFVLRGQDEPAVRDLLGAREVAEFFEAHAGVCAAGAAREVLFWRPRRRVKPGEIERLAEEGFELARSLASGTVRRGAG